MFFVFFQYFIRLHCVLFFMSIFICSLIVLVGIFIPIYSIHMDFNYSVLEGFFSQKKKLYVTCVLQ